MKIGDHLVTSRIGYTHHGLYIGRKSVIHYSGFANDISSGVIEIASLASFCNGNEVWVQPYKNRKYSAKESVSRARSRLGEDWYNLLLNNCEHFVAWCITGCHMSAQVNDAVSVVESVYSASQLSKACSPVLARSLVSGGNSLVCSALSLSSAISPSLGVSSLAGTSALAGAGSVLSTAAAPAVATVAAAYGVAKLVDWLLE